MPFLAPSLHYRQALGQNALYASPQTCTISHSLKKHPGPGTGQALRFRHGCRSLPLGGLPGCLGLEGGEKPKSRDAQRQPESVQEPPGQRGRTRHPRLTRQHTQGTERCRHGASAHLREVSEMTGDGRKGDRKASLGPDREGPAEPLLVFTSAGKWSYLKITQFSTGGP